MGRHQPLAARLVERLLLELDGERTYLMCGELRRQLRHDGGVEAAAEVHAHLDIAAQTYLDAFTERLPYEGDGLLLVALERGAVDAQFLVQRYGAPTSRDRQEAAHRHLPDAPERGVIGQRSPQCVHRGQFPRVELVTEPGVGRERLHLRGEEESTVLLRVEEWPLAVSVAGQDQCPGPGVTNRQGEGTVETGEAPGPPLDPRLQYDLGVRLGAERPAQPAEFGPEFHMVVQLAVEADPVPLGGIRHGLRTRCLIDDRQADRPHCHTVVQVVAGLVGPSVLD